MLTINSSNYLSNYPNLLLMVNRSKKIEVNEMIKPNIINGLDLTFSFLSVPLEEDRFSFLLIRLRKGLITIKFRFMLITLEF